MFKSADIQVLFRVKSNVKLPSMSTKKVREKSHKETRKRGKTIEKQRKWGEEKKLLFSVQRRKNMPGGREGKGSVCS